MSIGHIIILIVGALFLAVWTFELIDELIDGRRMLSDKRPTNRPPGWS